MIVLATLLLATPSIAHADGEHRSSDLEREDLGTAMQFQPTSPTAEHLMHGLLCQCPGCQPKRITIQDCACGYAAKQRQEVLAVLASHDLATASGRTAAEHAVTDDQVGRYGRQVLAQPSSATVWMFPLIATLGGLGLVFGGVSRWRRRRVVPGAAARVSTLDDELLAERLDDELALVD
ncbi:MAG: cytochrome c-type biogenesis protein CcmH [Myxococcales bacterium]|nr:cytochrome c-type biogenesis protein CcmH [Myxococcales bacterium]